MKKILLVLLVLCFMLAGTAEAFVSSADPGAPPSVSQSNVVSSDQTGQAREASGLFERMQQDVEVVEKELRLKDTLGLIGQETIIEFGDSFYWVVRVNNPNAADAPCPIKDVLPANNELNGVFLHRGQITDAVPETLPAVPYERTGALSFRGTAMVPPGVSYVLIDTTYREPVAEEPMTPPAVQ